MKTMKATKAMEDEHIQHYAGTDASPAGYADPAASSAQPREPLMKPHGCTAPSASRTRKATQEIDIEDTSGILRQADHRDPASEPAVAPARAAAEVYEEEDHAEEEEREELERTTRRRSTRRRTTQEEEDHEEEVYVETETETEEEREELEWEERLEELAEAEAEAEIEVRAQELERLRAILAARARRCGC